MGIIVNLIAYLIASIFEPKPVISASARREDEEFYQKHKQ